MDRTFGGTLLALSSALLGTAAPMSWAQPCQPFWARGPAFPSLQYGGSTVAFDDGWGPALFGQWTSGGYPFRWRDGQDHWNRITKGVIPQFIGFAPPLLVLNNGAGPRLYIVGNVQPGFPPPYQLWTLVWDGIQQWAPAWPPESNWGAGYPVLSANLGDGQAIYGLQVFAQGVSGAAKRTAVGWQPLGGHVISDGIGLMTLQTAAGTTLYACSAGSIGGIVVNGFARWTGQTWEHAGDADHVPLYTPDLWVQFDDGSGPAIFALGGVTLHGQDLRGLVKFDGQHWSLVGQANPPGALYTMNTIAVFDDGRGPAIYIGGSFSNFGGVPATGIARYDGHSWSTLGDGVHGGEVFSIAAMPTSRGPSLFVIGGFPTAGGGAVAGMARWIGCPNCYANCDLSTGAPALTVNDFVCFTQKFAARDPAANCTVEATIDAADFVCFLSKFAAGCP